MSIVVIISFVLGLLPSFSQLLLSTSIDGGISILINSLVSAGNTFVLLFGIVTFIASLLALTVKSNRYIASKVLFICLCVVVFAFGGRKLQPAIQTKQFEDLADRSRPLIAAISRFEKEQGRPPNNLAALVPSYTSKVPHTGIAAYPNYEYHALSTGLGRSLKHSDAAWALSVSCPVGFLDCDYFYYLPTEKYSDCDFVEMTEPIKNWVYLRR
ncbi:hypothetical protein BH11CYA1_BH11CYA1_08220 [soil metagenome]